MQPKEAGDLEAIEEKIASLIPYRSGLVKEIRNLREKKRDLGEEVRKLSTGIRKEREALDECYKTLKFCSEKRKENLAKIRELKGKVREVEKDLKRFESHASRDEGGYISQKIKTIDWKLQTEKHTREEEKQLIGLVKELEAKLYMWKKAYEKRQGLTKLLDEMKELKTGLEDIDQMREEAGAELEARKNRLTTSFKAREQLFNEMNGLDQDIAELEQNIVNTDGQLEEIKARRREMIQVRRARETEMVKAKEREMLEKAVHEAKEKMAQGRKLTFDELKLIMSEDQVDSSDRSSTISNV